MNNKTVCHRDNKRFAAIFLLNIILICNLIGQVYADESDSYIWWEGEAFIDTNSPRPVDPSTPGNQRPEEREKLSGGKWMTVKPPKDGSACTIQYQVEVPVGKTYHFWVRKFWKHGPFKWRFNGQEWRTCGKNIALADSASLQNFWTVSWVFLGKVELAAGTHTLDIEMIENKGCFDCWLLTDKPFTPRGLLKPGEKSGLAEPGYFAWEPDYDTHGAGCPIDLRYLNEQEAGKNGRVRRQGNGFVTGDGKPVRFWIVEGNSLLDMEKSKIDYWARRLAKYGVNMVRVGIIPLYEPYNEGDMEGFERARDKLQYTVAALKKQGIYTYIAHLLRHTRKTIPGKFAGPGYSKRVTPYGLSFFSSQFRDHYMGYVGKTLTAANPYTGLPLAKDPAVAFLEIQNETGLLFWTFDPKKMVPQTRMLIEKAFGDWAAEKYGSVEAALNAWGPEKAPGEPSVDVPAQGRLGLYNAGLLTSMPWAAKNRNPRRASDQLQFMVETQKTFYETMIKRLRQETGLESLIACSNWKTADPKTLGVLERYTYTAGDVICRNVYYSVTHKPKAKLAYTVSVGDTFQGLSTLKAPSMPSPLTIGHVNDYPYMITENAWTQPNRFRTEWPFLVATYGSMMGVDGWNFFPLKDAIWSTDIWRWQVTTPCVFGQFPAAAIIFRQGYVKEAPNAVTEELALEDLYAFKGSYLYEMSGTDDTWVSRIGDREGGADSEADQPEPRAFFVGKVNRTVGSEPGKLETVDFAKYIDPQARTVTSMTGQLSWDYGQGVVRVNTPCAQGAGGFLQAAGPLDLSDVTIESDNEYATVLVVSLDGRPLTESGQILIQAATEDKFYGFATEPKGAFRTVTSTGGYPLNVKEIRTRVTLKGITGNAVVLDANGYLTERSGKTSVEGDDLVIDLPEDALYTIIQ